MKQISVLLPEEDLKEFKRNLIQADLKISPLIKSWIKKYNLSKHHSTRPQATLIKEFKERIPLSKDMEEKILHPNKVGLVKKRGEMDVEDYV